MKLCFICNNWSESGDGKNLAAITDGLYKKGHAITIVPLLDEKSPDGYDHFRFLCIGRHGNAVSVWKEKKLLLKQIMTENNYDAVLCFGDEPSLFSLCARHEIKCPVIFCQRNDPDFSPESKLKRIARDKLYSSASAFVFQNKNQKKHYDSNKIRKNSYVIPDFLNSSYENSANFPKEKTIVCKARLDIKQKNLFMLFDGFIDFAKAYPEYTLKLYGEGADHDKCMEYIKSKGNEWNIKIEAVSENTESDLKTAEVFVLTSDFEGTPNELLPAMASGCTCISTNCGSVSSIISNGENGIIIPTNDSKTLTEALCYLAENESVRVALGNSAYEINKKLTEENVIPLWEQAISEIIANR